eukprot:SAG31_NODE_24944_length_471_cov_0.935484_1_plen_132_part_01
MALLVLSAPSSKQQRQRVTLDIPQSPFFCLPLHLWERMASKFTNYTVRYYVTVSLGLRKMANMLFRVANLVYVIYASLSRRRCWISGSLGLWVFGALGLWGSGALVLALREHMPCSVLEPDRRGWVVHFRLV